MEAWAVLLGMFASALTVYAVFGEAVKKFRTKRQLTCPTCSFFPMSLGHIGDNPKLVLWCPHCKEAKRKVG